MERSLLIFISFFLYQLICIDAAVHYVDNGCRNSSSAIGNAAPAIGNDTPINKSKELEDKITYMLNVVVVLSDLISKATDDRFYNTTAGDDPFKAYGLFQCRGDLGIDICKECVKQGMKKLDFQLCNNVSIGETFVWYEECMIRYSNLDIFSTYETHPSATKQSGLVSVSINEFFPTILAKAMSGLIDRLTSSASSHYDYAASVTNLTSSQNLYSFAQCTPDIDNLSCNRCLEAAFEKLNLCCNASIRAMVFLPSCQLRYDDKPFVVGEVPFVPYLSTDQDPPSSEKKSSKSENRDGNTLPESGTPRSNQGMIIGIASAVLAGLFLIVAGLWLCQRMRKKSSQNIVLEAHDGTQNYNLDVIRSLEALQFDFEMIKTVTSNFAEGKKLGQGGFGEVYKGTLLNGQEIAVKRLSRDSAQGTLEFQNEALLVAKLQHRNLVKLLGFCVSGKERILAYEFLANLSLDRFLYDSLKRASLAWEIRYKIITGVARGLLYLHEDSRLKIIHRDLKISNILLDEAMNPKIADFGLAKLFDIDQKQGDTGRIAGTYGYMAPEYALAGQFSAKSDVYSFGVIVLEVVTGQRNRLFGRDPNEEGLLNRAWRLWNEEAAIELTDPLLGGNFSVEEVELCILIGLLCVQEDPTKRPRMTSVVAALNGESITLPMPNAPHFFTIASVRTEGTSSICDSLPESELKQSMFKQSSRSHTGMTSITDLCPR